MISDELLRRARALNEKAHWLPAELGTAHLVLKRLLESLTEARAEVERLTAERDQARKDAVTCHDEVTSWAFQGDGLQALKERIRRYEADERAKGGG